MSNNIEQQNIDTPTTKEGLGTSWSRRDILKTIAILTGGAVMGSSIFLEGCKTKAGAVLSFSPTQLALLDEIGETILPATDTPGAKAAGIGKFMQTMVVDCYTPEQQKEFLRGLDEFDGACKKAQGKGFMECNAEQRKAFLISLEKEAKPYNEKVDTEEKKEREAAKTKGWQAELDYQGKPRHYYTMMKQLTLWGYFSSEVGMTKAMQYMPVPSKYDGAYPYKKGDKIFCS
jgi:hypothetical protein